jgi:hypothetical protein
MSTIAPPPAPMPVSGSGGGGAVAVTVIADSGSLEGLPAGTALEAYAQARAAKGVITAATPQGPLLLKALPGQTLPPIPDGARLLFQVLEQGGEMRLALLAVNGRPLGGAPLPGAGQGLGQGLLPGGGAMAGLLRPSFPGGPTQAAPQPGQTPNPAATGLVPSGPAAAAGPTGLTATVIRAAAPTANHPGPPSSVQTAGLPPDLPAGTRLTVRIAGITPPQPPSPPGAPPPSATSPAPASPSHAGLAKLPEGQAAPLTAGAPPPLPGAAPSPRLLQATVIAHPPGGQAVVQTPAGTLALPTHADLPVGTRLELEVAGPPLPPTNPPASAPRPEGLTKAGWPALTEAMTNLAGSNDRQVLDLLMRNLPQIGPRLAANISLFTNAMRSGDVKAVIGDGAAKGLEKAGRKDLAERLKADLEDLAAESGRSLAGGEWRGFTLPMVFGQIVDPIRLYVRQAGGDDETAARGANGERFLLDFNLSRLGRMQMDGLVRREDKLFDLIIRTDAPLPGDMRREILGIFTNASELVGTKGSVAFQAGGRWIEPAPDEPSPTEILA